MEKGGEKERGQRRGVLKGVSLRPLVAGKEKLPRRG